MPRDTEEVNRQKEVIQKYIAILADKGYEADIHPDTRACFLDGYAPNKLKILVSYGFESTEVFCDLAEHLRYFLNNKDIKPNSLPKGLPPKIRRQHFACIDISKRYPNHSSLEDSIIFYALTGPCARFHREWGAFTFSSSYSETSTYKREYHLNDEDTIPLVQSNGYRWL